MADVAVPMDHHGHTSSVGSMGAGVVHGSGPVIEMLANPDFSFPRCSSTAAVDLSRKAPSDFSPRPVSMQFGPPANPTSSLHRRAASTLPSFSFNAADASGLRSNETSPPMTPDECESAYTPTKRGHRRGGSEFVGGDSRFGVAKAVSSSPTKTNSLPLPVTNPIVPPAGRRGHAHRRSQAMSSHDVSSIIQPGDVEPRVSTSLPTTPLAEPFRPPPPSMDRSISAPDVRPLYIGPVGPIGGDVAGEPAVPRPASRRLVAFDDQVEIIPRPRPLSTISSETESSVSTIRGHSVNNSISSVLTLSNPGTPATRTPPKAVPRPRVSAAERDAHVKMALDSRRPEDQWIVRSRSQSPAVRRPKSESAADLLAPSIALDEATANPRLPHKKMHSLGSVLGFDRRRSEPVLGRSMPNDPQRLSAISLGESDYSAESTVSGASDKPGHKSSAKRITSWAKAKLLRKSKDFGKVSSVQSTAKEHVRIGGGDAEDNAPVAAQPLQSATPELDLDAVFAIQSANDLPRAVTPSQPRIEVTPTSPKQLGDSSLDPDDASPMVDLDAALGPLKTPSMSTQHRRRLHSDDKADGFSGPGLHYHRRAESVPIMPIVSFNNRSSMPPHLAMDDVFEEEEPPEEGITNESRPASTRSGLSSAAAGTGISIVDLDPSTADLVPQGWATDGLGIQRDWEPERPSTSYSNSPRLSAFGGDRRGSSIVEETIIEEPTISESGVLEIVQDHEEPRASSTTKSSDSSDTPTILAQPTMLPLSGGDQSLMTPDTYQTSTFSSPDFARRQASFETSRVGTAASSIADNRTNSSCMTGDGSQSLRISMDDVPSLTSSRSTMMSSTHVGGPQREGTSSQAPSTTSASVASTNFARQKRASIGSLSQLVGGPFASPKTKADESRPRTSSGAGSLKGLRQKNEHRLKKLMFWRSKRSDKNNVIAET